MNPDRVMLTSAAAHFLKMLVLGLSVTVTVSSAHGCIVLLLPPVTATEIPVSNETVSIESA